MVLQPFLLSNRGCFCSQFLSKDQGGVAERERGVIGEGGNWSKYVRGVVLIQCEKKKKIRGEGDLLTYTTTIVLER